MPAQKRMVLVHSFSTRMSSGVKTYAVELQTEVERRRERSEGSGEEEERRVDKE